MSGFEGFVQAGLQLGLDSIIVHPNPRGIYYPVGADGTVLPDVVAQAIIEEKHHDELQITEHPVEQGALISDHAYKRPAEVTLTLGWSNSPPAPQGVVNGLVSQAINNSTALQQVANIGNIASAGLGILSQLSGAGIDQIRAQYQTLLYLQETAALFTLFTGKRTYPNMICKSLATETDYRSENNLIVTMVCKQLILVNTSIVTLPASIQMNPQATASPTNKGTQSVSPSNITPGQ